MEIARLRAVVEVEDQQLRDLGRDAPKVFKDVEQGAEKAGASVESFGQKLGKLDGGKLQDIGRNLSVGITAPLIAGAGAAVMMASSTEEALSRVNVVFGSGAKAIDEWSKTAAVGFGQSRAEALSAAGDFGALFTAMELGQGQSAQMSRTMVQLAGDLASFKDVKPEEAMVALRSGLVGESEPLRRFGVNLSEAKIQAEALKMGLVSVKGEALDPAAKAQAAYNIILRETATAHGDYGRTSDSLANTMRTMKAELSDTAAAFGKELIPAVKDALGVAKDLLHTFNNLPEPMKKAAGAGALFAAAIGPILSGAGTAMNLAKMFGGGGGGAPAVPAGAPVAGAGIGSKLLGGVGKVLGHLEAPMSEGDQSNFLKNTLGKIIGEKALNSLLGRSGDAAKKAAVAGAAGGTGAATAAGGASPYAPIAGTGTAAIDPKELKLRAQAGDAEFAFRMQSSTNAAGHGPEQFQAQREAASGVPLLTARSKELAEQAKKLEPLIKEDADSARAYWQLRRDEANLIEQAGKLQHAAVKEVAENQKKAVEAQKTQRENVKRYQDNAFREQLAGAEAQAASRTEEGKAFGRLEEVVPVLEARQKALTAEAASLAPLVRSSWEAATRRQEVMAEIAGIERQEQTIQRSAIEERTRNEKKAADEAKKTAEATKKLFADRATSLKQIADQVMGAFKNMNAERLGLAGARVGLAEAQLRNLPGNDRQKKQMLQPLLLKQLQETSRGVQGESELDRLNRLTNAEGIKGRLLETVAPGQRGLALRQLGMVQQDAERNPVNSKAVAESAAAARQAAALAPKPLILQLFMGEKPTPESLWKVFLQMQEAQNRQSGLIGAAG